MRQADSGEPGGIDLHYTHAEISDPIAANLGIEPDDFEYAPFTQEGGLGKVYQLLGDELNTLN